MHVEAGEGLWTGCNIVLTSGSGGDKARGVEFGKCCGAKRIKHGGFSARQWGSDGTEGDW